MLGFDPKQMLQKLRSEVVDCFSHVVPPRGAQPICFTGYGDARQGSPSPLRCGIKWTPKTEVGSTSIANSQAGPVYYTGGTPPDPYGWDVTPESFFDGKRGVVFPTVFAYRSANLTAALAQANIGFVPQTVVRQSWLLNGVAIPGYSRQMCSGTIAGNMIDTVNYGADHVVVATAGSGPVDLTPRAPIELDGGDQLVVEIDIGSLPSSATVGLVILVRGWMW